MLAMAFLGLLTFLSMILFLVPDPNYILLCWPSAN